MNTSLWETYFAVKVFIKILETQGDNRLRSRLILKLLKSIARDLESYLFKHRGSGLHLLVLTLKSIPKGILLRLLMVGEWQHV